MFNSRALLAIIINMYSTRSHQNIYIKLIQVIIIMYIFLFQGSYTMSNIPPRYYMFASVQALDHGLFGYDFIID